MQRQDWTGAPVPALGMGCWAIGGPFSLEGRPVGWGETDDAVSRATIAAAYEAGLRVFDSAQAYGAGHSEALLGEVLGDKPDARVVTKIGLGIDPARRELTGVVTDPDAIRDSLEASLRRLRRDQVDLVLLHLNDLPLDQAAPIFDMLQGLHDAGRVGAYGWSTDFPDRAAAFPEHVGFRAVELAMNVFFRGDKISDALDGSERVPLIRSPLAMGLLAGRIGATTVLAEDDVRASDAGWMQYFKDGRANPAYVARLEAVRECLTVGGRSLAQGALAWLWARSPRCIPVPGMRTPEQAAELVAALDLGPLPQAQMEEIEKLMDRPEEGEPRAR
ncbi:putative aldo/keto reductase [Candidatus Rhodobacter oscarellae]|uniref:Putative aldo/keto reductase n=1 Tax=Candidatus Rhodobacter oscarellae TaxID=1675527 RepID=A0A0J9E416_9RHOB|nr:aldo/keto reductase [Candidatus Rhodobacter lobularis]KMW57556.1 putative aldo/keto reductase [Candidatus Rhodobacter lobularis]